MGSRALQGQGGEAALEKKTPLAIGIQLREAHLKSGAAHQAPGGAGRDEGADRGRAEAAIDARKPQVGPRGDAGSGGLHVEHIAGLQREQAPSGQAAAIGAEQAIAGAQETLDPQQRPIGLLQQTRRQGHNAAIHEVVGFVLTGGELEPESLIQQVQRPGVADNFAQGCRLAVIGSDLVGGLGGHRGQWSGIGLGRRKGCNRG